MFPVKYPNSTETDSKVDFVTRQVRLRMGRFYHSEFNLDVAHLRDRLIALNRKRPLVFQMKNGLSNIVYEDEEHKKNRQFMNALEERYDSIDSVYCADFEDSIPKHYPPFSSECIPFFSKNRPVGAETSVILWTHANYRHNRELGIASRSRKLPWKKKIPDLIWRGRARGSIENPNGAFFRAGRIYAATVKTEPHTDLFLEKYRGCEFKDVASDLFDRFKLISEYSQKFDVRFVDFPNPDAYDIGFREYIEENYQYAESMSIEDIARYKYLFVLGGNDAGTQINWALSSRSVILMPPIRFHSTTTLGLKEWIHYVPVAKGLADLEEKVEWCRQNDEQCRAIARNAWKYISKFTSENENLINDEIIARYNSNRKS